MSDSLQGAQLQDIPGTALREQFRDVRARNSPICDAEYGARDSDNALVLHFYPPGYGLDVGKDWENWTAFRDRLEQALMKYFTVEHIDAGYVQELKSFYAIISPRPLVPDLTALLEHFFAALEAER